jgi:glycosyltransferase involved in cell wall biosynthesis
MSALKLLFFVNNSETSAVGLRASQFAQRLPQDWQVQLQYRPQTKWKGILPFIQAAIAFQPDVIYVMDIAYTGVIAGVIAKQLTRCKLLIDTGDATYALAQSTGRYSKKQLALIDWTEKLALSQADHLIVRGSYHQDYLKEQGYANTTVIPDGLEIEKIQTHTDPNLKQKLGLADNFIVGLVGHMVWSERHQFCYGWDIIEAIALLPDLPIKALLVGDGDGRPYLEKRVAELGIQERVVFTGLVPFDQLPNYLAIMNIGVSTQTNDLPGRVRTTGKLPVYLAYNLYVIATAVGEAQKVLPEVGSLLPYEGVKDLNHPQRLAMEVRSLYEQPERLKTAQKGRKMVEQYFNLTSLVKRVEQACLMLTGQSAQ